MAQFGRSELFTVLWLPVRVLGLRIRECFTQRLIRKFQAAPVSRHAVKKRNFPLATGLTLCIVSSVIASVFSVMSQGAPGLRDLRGGILRTETLQILDPNRRDEAQLAPGYLYDRPVAVLQMGRAPVLVRARLEERLFTLRRSPDGLEILQLENADAAPEQYLPRTVSEETALKLLREAGFCRKNDTWGTALQKKLPETRFPGEEDYGGRLLLFEQKVVAIRDDTGWDPDYLELLSEEDIINYKLDLTTYKYMGFFQQEGAAGERLFQPVHAVLGDAAEGAVPGILSFRYEYFAWEENLKDVHYFHESQENGSAQLHMGTNFHPITDWSEPNDAWYYDADGWIYYGQAVLPGVMTTRLLEGYSVESDSPLVRDETRYQLRVFLQEAPLQKESLLKLWNSGTIVNQLGYSQMSNDAAKIASYFISNS